MPNCLAVHEIQIRAGVKKPGQEGGLPGSRNKNRKAGDGRKSALDCYAGVDELFLAVLQEHAAGDPINEQSKWTNLIGLIVTHWLKLTGIDCKTGITSIYPNAKNGGKVALLQIQVPTKLQGFNPSVTAR